ncbi:MULTISPECIES: hypothetical protein [unclassified Paenibacillus]|uniref:fascin domain-containing protein n=1 Tax=unclassified Paenibacillus TaxID=185978 RepID=UPI001F29B3E9|nr:hypothetical protein [Paenibacillus sp. JJ-223]CAH1190797.1 hypothetical protein PAECIP111890_00156 [Paenibacillus sp. JJ-223]
MVAIQHTDGLLFKTRAGYFLNTDNGTGPVVKMQKEANRNPGVSDEIWFIERLDGAGSIQPGEPILIKSRAGYFLNTDHGIGPVVKMQKEANRDPGVSDEIWFIERLDGAGSIQPGEPILIKSRAGYFLNTDHGTGPVVKMQKEANRDPGVSDEIWFTELIVQNDEVQPCSDGKGEFIYSGTASVDIVSVDYKIYECEIELLPKIIGIRTGGEYFLRKGNNSVTATWPEADGITRYQFKAWVNNKELWVEIEHQHKTVEVSIPPKTHWTKTAGAKTKLGSWSNLKI